MIEPTCGPSCAFSLITWLVMVQSKHNIHQKKAEYLSYQMVSVTLFIFVKMKNLSTRQYINFDFLPYFFWMLITLNIIQSLPKSFAHILAIVMEGTRPEFLIYVLSKIMTITYFKCFPIFGLK